MGKSDPATVGVRLRAVMVELGFSNSSDFAAALGTAPSAASNWMNGYNMPNLQTLRRLLELLPDLTLEWLYFGEESKMPKALVLRLDIRIKAWEQGLDVPVAIPEPRPVTVRAVRPRRRPTRSAEIGAGCQADS